MEVLTNPTVAAALVSATIALLGVAVTLYATRAQLRSRAAELEIRAKEIDLRSAELGQLSTRLEAELEALRQAQLQEVLRARIVAYPKLWHVLLTYGRNWGLKANPAMPRGRRLSSSRSTNAMQITGFCSPNLCTPVFTSFAPS